MDSFDEQEPNPRRTGKVRCNKCGQVFWDDLLYLNGKTGMWCCKDWPKCKGAGIDIVAADPPSSGDSSE